VALQKEDYSEALEHYNSVLGADSSYVTAHYGRAMAHRGLGDTIQAIAALRTFRAHQVRGDP
jgi:lipoprotein NlpI